ncbi:MAG: hypothetical protein ACI910_002447 [Oleispira sp.]|jgi:hypothetical protein
MRLSVMSSHKQVMKRLSVLKKLWVRRLFLLFILPVFFSVQVYAIDRSEIMEAFPRAELVKETQLNNTEYRLVLSGLKRKRAVTSGEVERLIGGDVNRQFWQISTNHEVEQILEYFLSQWEGAQIMYRCSGLDCGSSNFWANDIFNNAKLYGRDADQSYVVAMIPGNPNRIYVLYAVQRSKQKLYFNLDQITSSDALTDNNVDRQNIIASLQKESGWLEGLNTVDGHIDEQKSDILLSTLKNLDATIKRRLYLVVHCYQANNMADNFACSTRLAQQLRAAIYQDFEIAVFGHGALTLPPGKDLKPQLRFMLWPRHH